VSATARNSQGTPSSVARPEAEAAAGTDNSDESEDDANAGFGEDAVSAAYQPNWSSRKLKSNDRDGGSSRGDNHVDGTSSAHESNSSNSSSNDRSAASVVTFGEWSCSGGGGGGGGGTTSQQREGRNQQRPQLSSSLATLPKIEFLEIELCAGDALFLPARWWHMVESASPWSAAVNWYFEPLAGVSV